MPRASKVDAIVVLALAFVFYLFFQVSKQVPVLASVNASADDPYDAIGSFGMLAAAFFGLLSALRAFRGRRAADWSSADSVFLHRAHMATVLVVAVALTGDAVAMARHPAVWIGRSAGPWYAVALAAVALSTAFAGYRVGRAGGSAHAVADRGAWARAGVAVVAFVAILALYPEGITQTIPGALLTVVVGAVLLFAPARMLLLALVPSTSDTSAASVGASRPLRRRAHLWALVAAAGVTVGIALVAAEIGTAPPGPPPPAGVALVVAVYVGLATAGIMLGYGFLGGPVGLFRRPGS